MHSIPYRVYSSRIVDEAIISSPFFLLEFLRSLFRIGRTLGQRKNNPNGKEDSQLCLEQHAISWFGTVNSSS